MVEGYIASCESALFLFGCFFFAFGGLDVLKHFVLRSILWITGQFPWRVGGLFDHAARLHLVQRVGGGERVIGAALGHERW